MHIKLQFSTTLIDIGEKEGKEKYQEYLNKTRFCHTKEDYIKRYGEEKGIQEYEKHKNDCVRTEETFIKKYGEIEGKNRWELYRQRQSLTNTFKYKNETYGWSKEQFNDYNKSRAITLKNLINKYGKIEGQIRWNNYRDLQKYTKTKEYLIEKFGEEKGVQEYQKICSKKVLTLENFVKKYGEKTGTEKFKNYVSNSHKGYSSISNSLFKLIENANDKGHKIFYGLNEKQFVIDYDDIKVVVLDFYNETTNKAIEFYGDYWHGNPNVYSGNQINKHSKQTYDEIRNHDKKRIDAIKLIKNIDIKIVWEYDFRNDKDNLILNDLISWIYSN